jgi:Leo1-like protein
VKWSDGTQSLLIGDEFFEVYISDRGRYQKHYGQSIVLDFSASQRKGVQDHRETEESHDIQTSQHYKFDTQEADDGYNFKIRQDWWSQVGIHHQQPRTDANQGCQSISD